MTVAAAIADDEAARIAARRERTLAELDAFRRREPAGSDLGKPKYVDFFNKLSFSLTPRWSVSTGALTLDDKISLNDGDVAQAGADYGDSYLWLQRVRRATGRRPISSSVRRHRWRSVRAESRVSALAEQMD